MDLPCAFAEDVGTGHVLSDPELKSSYEHDHTGRHDAPARTMVRPAATGEAIRRPMGNGRRVGVAAVRAVHGAQWARPAFPTRLRQCEDGRVPGINQALADELARMAAVDQRIRFARVDVANTDRLREIIERHGWPGKSLVGEKR
jgi:hypothetical protein